jgi:hypothetical protein
MRRIYSAILNLYPRDFRLRFRGEMLAAWDGRRPLGEMAGLLRGAAREWIDKWTTPAMIRGRRLPDLQRMRPVGVTKRDWFGDSPGRLPEQ